jgi:hypothetical protein
VRECAHGHLPVRPQLVRSTLTEARSDDILANDTPSQENRGPGSRALQRTGGKNVLDIHAGAVLDEIAAVQLRAERTEPLAPALIHPATLIGLQRPFP